MQILAVLQKGPAHARTHQTGGGPEVQTVRSSVLRDH